MKSTRIAYVGFSGSGRGESLRQLLARHGPLIPRWSLQGEYSISLRTTGSNRPLVLAANEFRGWLAYSDPLAPDLDPRVRAEIDQLPTFDGFVYVIDSREFRMFNSKGCFGHLRQDLQSRGVDPNSVPIVFQGNFRDADNIHTMEWIREHFTAPRCAYVESVASKGMGVVEAVNALVSLIGH